MVSQDIPALESSPSPGVCGEVVCVLGRAGWHQRSHGWVPAQRG